MVSFHIQGDGYFIFNSLWKQIYSGDLFNRLGRFVYNVLIDNHKNEFQIISSRQFIRNMRYHYYNQLSTVKTTKTLSQPPIKLICFHSPFPPKQVLLVKSVILLQDKSPPFRWDLDPQTEKVLSPSRTLCWVKQESTYYCLLGPKE